MNALTQDEYRDYLVRYGDNERTWTVPPLTYQEFCAALKRWEHEYHIAWSVDQREQMARLEALLML